VNKRNRLFAAILLIYVLGVGLLLYRVGADLDGRYRESAEESLVDTAHLLAAVIEDDLRSGSFDAARLRRVADAAYQRRFAARIFGHTKSRVDLRVYVTDADGRVVFDSMGAHEGEDFRKWRDVALTLQGEYGARTTPERPDDPGSAVMYVAAPVRAEGRIVGVVGVGKPVGVYRQFVASARQKLLVVGLVSVASAILLLLVVSLWLVLPAGLLTDALRLRGIDGVIRPSRVLRRMWGLLVAVFRDWRDTLAGRSYTEDYVQALTHELKSPLSAIRGAAELLREPVPDEPRRRFASSIAEQVHRIQDLVDRLLQLASLEKRRTLDEPEAVPLKRLAEDAAASLEPVARLKGVTIRTSVPEDLVVGGDPFLLHQAVSNLLQNAIDFSPRDAVVEVTGAEAGRTVELSVRDRGPGVPDYAIDRAFEKFYSLRRPDTGKKSTGLGLSFVREIAQLHRGTAALANHPGGGAIATLRLPRIASSR
jgi:two-component system sensor histidine kinase CreC